MTKFFTNRDNNTLYNKLAGVFEHNKGINNFDILVGYFRASGYFKIRPLLNNIDNIRILVGIDVDEISRTMQQQGVALSRGDNKQTAKDWHRSFTEDIQDANYDSGVEQGILQFIDDTLTQKVQVRAHPSRNIHAKIYIFRPDNFNEHNAGNVITGSSNLSEGGLGTRQSSNYEFNVLLNDYADITFASNEFEQLWSESQEILPTQIEQSKNETYLNDSITAYELYLKCLIEYFGAEIEFDPNSIHDLPSNFIRLSYQMDAVNEGLGMLKKHNGFFLADVVGLGKTIIATLIARQFYFQNGYPGYRSRILLVIPPAIRHNWQETLNEFKIDDMVEIITNGSIHKIENARKYDMVIVDEAHKFRNVSEAYDCLQRLCKTPTETEKPKKVILISATPLNNRPSDLYNQILLFQDGNNSTLDLPLVRFFDQAKKEYKEIVKLPNKQDARKRTKLLYEKIRQQALMPLMVRRTRTDLMDNERYRKDLEERKINFPQSTPPQPIYYQLDSELELLYDSTVTKISGREQKMGALWYTRYQILQFLKPELKKRYKQAETITERLVALMKTLLLKRMDSSFHAFKETLGRFIRSSERMLKMIANNKIIIAPNIDINKYILEDKEDELMEVLANASLNDPSIIVCSTADFEPGFVEGVEHDYEMLQKLKADWDRMSNDPKIETFLQCMPQFLAKENNPQQKIIVFTESSDTMHYLSGELSTSTYKDKVLVVNAQNRDSLKQTIRHNFDANIDPADKRDNYRIIITTDVLAEGVNLHRANTVINYDTPWNSSKLIQRIGRVNRIGQVASHIFVYNFYPTTQINNDIDLEKRALIKLQAFHSALGEDSQIYSPNEQTGTFGIFNDNVQAEKNEIIPLLEEIRAFKKNNPSEYRRIKNLPSKVRNAVENTQHAGATVVFARTKDRGSSRFYLVNATDKGGVENYGFLKTATLLQCTPESTTVPLHQQEQHYTQVRSALDTFQNEIRQNINERTHNKTISPQDKKAIRFLQVLAKLPNVNADEQAQLNRAIAYIENKRFQKLSKSINKLNKNSKGIKPIVILESALNIIATYDTDKYNETTHTPTQSVKNTNPSVVISQSYV